ARNDPDLLAELVKEFEARGEIVGAKDVREAIKKRKTEQQRHTRQQERDARAGVDNDVEDAINDAAKARARGEHFKKIIRKHLQNVSSEQRNDLARARQEVLAEWMDCPNLREVSDDFAEAAE